MKFSEMPYQRPNLDEIKAQFAAVTQRFAAAPDYAAAKAAFLDEQTLNKHVDAGQPSQHPQHHRYPG